MSNSLEENIKRLDAWKRSKHEQYNDETTGVRADLYDYLWHLYACAFYVKETAFLDIILEYVPLKDIFTVDIDHRARKHHLKSLQIQPVNISNDGFQVRNLDDLLHAYDKFSKQACLDIKNSARVYHKHGYNKCSIIQKNVINAPTGYFRTEYQKMFGVPPTQCTACQQIGTIGQNLQICSRCKVQPYCSKACQTRDWKQNHRHKCQAVETLD